MSSNSCVAAGSSSLLNKAPAMLVPETHASEDPHGLQNAGSIPAIDMDKLRNHSHGRMEAVKEIGRACEQWGFFYVVNHGVEEKIIEDMWEVFRGLLSYSKELPPEDKLQLDLCVFPKKMREMLMSNKEAASKYISIALNHRRTSLHYRSLNPDDGEASPELESTPHSFRTPACKFYSALRNVGIELLEAVSESLGMPFDTMDTIIKRNGAINSTMHYYDTCLDTPITCLLPHKDPYLLTVLLADPKVGGLQVMKDEQWVDVKPMQGSLVVNLGEVIEVITNGKYKGPVHRVVNNVEKERSSISCFLLPAEDAIFAPFPQFVDQWNSTQYTPQTMQDLLANTFAPLSHLLDTN